MNKKIVQVAKLNVIFPEMINIPFGSKYFEKMVIPALKSGINNVHGDITYFFLDIEFVKDILDQEFLIGKIVKNTFVEKNSSDSKGNIKGKADICRVDTYSDFVIKLKSNQILYVQNNADSPTLDCFSTTLEFAQLEYIRKYNNKQKNKENHLALPSINISCVSNGEILYNTLKHFFPYKLYSSILFGLIGNAFFETNIENMAFDLIRELRLLSKNKNSELQITSLKKTTVTESDIQQFDEMLCSNIKEKYIDKCTREINNNTSICTDLSKKDTEDNINNGEK